MQQRFSIKSRSLKSVEYHYFGVSNHAVLEERIIEMFEFSLWNPLQG